MNNNSNTGHIEQMPLSYKSAFLEGYHEYALMN
jgi:hypothetical protein